MGIQKEKQPILYLNARLRGFRAVRRGSVMNVPN